MGPVQLWETPPYFPNVCIRCGCGTGQRKYFIDLGITLMGHFNPMNEGSIYYCDECAPNLVDDIGKVIKNWEEDLVVRAAREEFRLEQEKSLEQRRAEEVRLKEEALAQVQAEYEATRVDIEQKATERLALFKETGELGGNESGRTTITGHPEYEGNNLDSKQDDPVLADPIDLSEPTVSSDDADDAIGQRSLDFTYGSST